MGQINLTNSKQRDAVVNTRSVRVTRRVRYIDAEGRQAAGVRLLKSTFEHEAERLAEAAGGPDELSQALVEADPDVDMETFGQQISETSRVYVTPEREVVHHVQIFEVLKNPDGSEKERRPQKISEANIAVEGTPLRWSGKLMPKKDVYNKFVFSGMMQITHVNGLTYDFLYEMAKELEEKEAMMLLGAGAKGTLPLVFTRGGNTFRGFLEGRTDGNRYLLLLHLSNMELKTPELAE